jgi:ribosomal protein S20
MVRMTLLAAVMLFGVAPMVQAASCKDQLAEIDKLMNAAAAAPKKQQAEEYVQKAKAALDKEDENGCIVHAQNARRMLAD